MKKFLLGLFLFSVSLFAANIEEQIINSEEEEGEEFLDENSHFDSPSLRNFSDDSGFYTDSPGGNCINITKELEKIKIQESIEKQLQQVVDKTNQ